MTDLLWDFRFVAILLIVVVLYAIFAWKDFKQRAYMLMLQAKSMAKDKILNSGIEQETWVLEKAYIYLPKSITVFIKHEEMRKIIHYLYVKAKDLLDDGKLNDSEQ